MTKNNIVRNVLISLIGIFLTGCSIVTYAPVVGSSAVGLDKVTLRDSPEYAQIINSTVKLTDTSDYNWTLRKFTKGRYFIERTYPSVKSTQEICSLNGRDVIIKDIYEDRINGGIFYSAVVSCDGGSKIEATKNHWSNTLLHLFRSPIT